MVIRERRFSILFLITTASYRRDSQREVLIRELQADFEIGIKGRNVPQDGAK